MVHDSMRNLRLDKRLLRRRGWIDPAELGRELESLPDVESKADRVAVLERGGDAGDADRGATGSAGGAGEGAS